MTRQRVLVTGASGFIGRRLVPHLRQCDMEVFALGRTAPSDPNGERIGFLRCDLADPAALESLRPALDQIDHVVHLGGFVLRSNSPAEDDALLAMRLNAEGTARLLQYLPSELAGFCYVSTVDVYGPPQFLPLNEEHPTRPASFYGASKLAAEMLLRVFGERAAVPVTVLRLAQVYGPGDTSRKAIPNFIRSALRGDAIVIQGDGSDERDYVFVDDVVIAIELALTRHASGTFNIAGGHACSIRDVVTAIARLTGNTKTLVWERRATPATRQALDISAAEQHLDYRPRVNLEEGLRHTVAWFRQNACV